MTFTACCGVVAVMKAAAVRLDGLTAGFMIFWGCDIACLVGQHKSFTGTCPPWYKTSV